MTTLLIFSCRQLSKNEEVTTLIDKKENRIEKGILVNEKKEGFWVTFDTNYVLQYDIQYKNDIPNGKSTNYYQGKISIEAEFLNGQSNGHYTSYHSYPIKEAEGNVQMGKKVGEWRTYTRDGRLNKIILFEKDTFRITLDNHLD
jgi:antitoxin component YwqK of YwqJK toxin-antitoxin module